MEPVRTEMAHRMVVPADMADNPLAEHTVREGMAVAECRFAEVVAAVESHPVSLLEPETHRRTDRMPGPRIDRKDYRMTDPMAVLIQFDQTSGLLTHLIVDPA